MRYDCGDPNCVIHTEAGKNFECVIAYTMATLINFYDLTAAHKTALSKISELSKPSAPAKSLGATVQEFFDLHDRIEKMPFDQSLLEASWSLLENVLNHLPDTEKNFFRAWVRPTEPTLAEMAFCRVIDGWKFYLEELSGKKYGEHRDVLQGEEISLDQILSETRNLFVHYGGWLGFNKLKAKAHADIYQKHLATLAHTKSKIVDLCRHAGGLSTGDRFQLGMRETQNYLNEISFMLETIEARQPRTI